MLSTYIFCIFLFLMTFSDMNFVLLMFIVRLLILILVVLSSLLQSLQFVSFQCMICWETICTKLLDLNSFHCSSINIKSYSSTQMLSRYELKIPVMNCVAAEPVRL